MTDSNQEHAGAKTGPQGKGRPLDRSRDVAILEAAVEILSESGYDRLSMDMVAARARAGKAALYRRWSSKAELVADALALQDPNLPEPDTGTLLGDLEVVFASKQPNDENYFQTSIVAGLMTACSRDPELAKAFRERFLKTGNRILRLILERGVARGEIPAGRDLGLVIQIVPALFFTRLLLTGIPPDAAFARRVITEVLYPLATAPLPPTTVSSRPGAAQPQTG
jgi:AcrR family transcriptional regulator